MRHKTTFLLAVVMVTTATAMLGCPHPWDAAHTALEVGAEAVARTDTIVAAGIVETNTTVRAELVAQARTDREAYEECIACMEADDCTPSQECGERPTVDYYMGQLAERLESWEAAVTALEVMREALLVAEQAVAAWRDLKQQPENWGAVCERLGTTQRSVVQAIEACGVDVPGQWESLLNGL